MRRIFKTRYFNRWMRKTTLTDSALCVAVSKMENGQVDADLGGGVLKTFRYRAGVKVAVRVPWWRPTRATAGSSFFAFGFEKSDRANVSARELGALQAIAADLPKLSATELDAHVESEALQEICHDS